MTDKIEPSKVIYDLAKAGVIERAAGGLYALEPSVRGVLRAPARHGTPTG